MYERSVRSIGHSVDDGRFLRGRGNANKRIHGQMVRMRTKDDRENFARAPSLISKRHL